MPARRRHSRPFPQVITSLIAIALAAAVVLGPSRSLAAQSAESPGVSIAPGAPSGVPARSGTAPSEVILAVRSFGLANFARAGDWATLLVDFTDRSPVARDIALQLEFPDADGDLALHRVVVATTPGQTGSQWIPIWLPFELAPGATIRVRALAADPGAPGADARAGVARAGRPLGSLDFAVRDILPSTSAMIGVVGTGRAGLDELAVAVPMQAVSFRAPLNALPTSHERAEIISGLRVRDLPDHWLGFSNLSALVWTGGASGEPTDPSDLSDAQLNALRQWVTRGGHLVILARGDSNWPTKRFADLWPRAAMQRNETAPLAPLLPLMRAGASAGSLILPPGVGYSTFAPDADAKGGEAVVVLNDDAGKPLVVRRLVGAGMVTISGLDVANPRLVASGAVRTDAFWNRLLGRRGRLLTQAELNDRLKLNPPVITLDRAEFDVDLTLADGIGMTAQAAGGAVIALIVFGTYWLVAGPLLFVVLRRRRAQRHAWVGFVAITCVFAVIAWGGAWIIRPARLEARHFTILDFVAGQSLSAPLARARSWVNVILPTHGTMTVDARADSAAPGANAITSWIAPPRDAFGGRGSGRGGGPAASDRAFPDARAYVSPARSPDAIPFPSRATSKALRIDWAGPVSWELPTPDLRSATSAAGNAAEPPIRVFQTPQGEWRAQGQLLHNLPGTLRDVTVLIVARQTPLSQPLGADPQTQAFAVSVADWAPGTALDLASVIGTPASSSSAGASTDAASWFDARSGVATSQLNPAAPAPVGTVRAWESVSFFLQLAPPQWQILDGTAKPLARRHSNQALDLSPWTTQPCVVVLGRLDGPTPIPLSVDAQPLPSSGTTVVRWVYPLPANPPAFSGARAP
jgi:hypothetical protein